MDRLFKILSVVYIVYRLVPKIISAIIAFIVFLLAVTAKSSEIFPTQNTQNSQQKCVMFSTVDEVREFFYRNYKEVPMDGFYLVNRLDMSVVTVFLNKESGNWSLVLNKRMKVPDGMGNGVLACLLAFGDLVIVPEGSERDQPSNASSS